MGASFSEMAAALADGVSQISLDQQVQFTVYQRKILPLDGFVFWAQARTVTLTGALHFTQDLQQNEDETFANGTVQFTSLSQLTDLALAGNDQLFVADASALGSTFRFSFSNDSFFRQSGLWHYIGRSIPPAMASLFLDTPGTVDLTRAVTSNSLALWLALNDYAPPYDGFSNSIMLLPSYVVTDNLVPPYISVHIGDDDTRGLQAVPSLDAATSSSSQLAADKVRLRLYGLQSNEAIDFLQCVMQYSRDTSSVGGIGLMNTPIIKDVKRPHAEIRALAQVKQIDFEVSYLQSRVNDVAQALIEEATFTFTVGSLVNPIQGGAGIITQSGQTLQTQAGQDLIPQ